MKHVIANLKMNPVSTAECDQYLASFAQTWKQSKVEGVTLTVCPPFPYVERFHKRLPKAVFLGVQDAFWETRGSFTGQVSPLMLQDLGVTRVLVGHSERRHYAGETSESVNRKVLALLHNSLEPIVCVGETAEERDGGLILQVVREQLETALKGVSGDQLGRVIVAYEPRWAIGSDRTSSAHEIMEMRVLLRKILTDSYGPEAAALVPLLYGGSVRADIMKEVCLDPGMDGVLVGRESLIPEELMKIAQALEG